MAFGLVNAPATLKIDGDSLARDGYIVYLDDVLVVGRDFEEYNSNLAKVFELLQLADLTFKPESCKFAQPQVHYLSCVVTAEGVQTDPCKLKAVSEFQVPNNVKSFRIGFILSEIYTTVCKHCWTSSQFDNLTKKDMEFRCLSEGI